MFIGHLALGSAAKRVVPRVTGRGRAAFLTLAALVVSHWVLDFVTHRPDMPIYPGGATYGLGLWNSKLATVAVEVPMFAAVGAAILTLWSWWADRHRVVLLAIAGLMCASSTLSAQTTQLPATIPIFPLEVTMIFPGVSRPLHIFEPRYRAMIADALKGDRIIGMTTLKPGFEADYGGRPPIYEIGCAGIITDVEELPGGRFNIVLRGLVKFRVTSEDDSRAYRLARVDALPEVLDEADKAALHKQRLRLEALVTKGSDTKLPPETTDEALVNWLAQYVHMTHAQRQHLLELNSVLLRARALIELIEAKGAVTAWLR